MIYNSEQDIIRLCIDKLRTERDSSTRLISAVPLGGGCINRALRITTTAGDFFLKWNVSAPQGMFSSEALSLQEMGRANSGLSIAEVIWCKEPDNLPGLLMMEYLRPASRTSGFDERLGRGLAHLHRKSAQAYGFYGPNYCGATLQDNTWTAVWSVFYAECRVWPLVRKIEATRGLSKDDLAVYGRLVEKMPDLLSHHTIPSLIHGDLWSGNYLFSEKGPALIDPACYYADREMELGMMLLFGGFASDVWNAYREEYPLPDDWEERVALYQLYHVLNHYLLFGGSYSAQAIALAKRYSR